jgi:cell division protease FtsH
MLGAVRNKPPVFNAPARPQAAKAAPAPPPSQDTLDRTIAQAAPIIAHAIAPVAALTKDVEMTAPENKALAEKVAAFSDHVRVLGAQVHPFVSYEQMFESWLGATPFHQTSETRDIAPLLPGLKFKGVHDVVSENYKVVHAVAAEGWNKAIVAPKFSQVRTDYDKSESIPTEAIYLCEDPKGNHVVVELRREWAQEPPQLTVYARDDQPELVTEFYDKLTDWTAKNNFYKNKVLQYIEPPMGPPYLDFQDGLKTKPTSWKDIVLDPKSEELLRSNTTDFFKELPIYKENGRFASRNLLLAGPPGTGKSMVNDILISELKNDVTFLYVTSKSIHSSGSISGIFDAARMLSPAIIIMEDLDLVGSADRKNNQRQDILNELLNQVSGVYDNTGVVVLGSTNQAGAFDEAMLRPLRFSTVVPMLPPDRDLRKTLLEKITKGIHLAPDVDLGALADRTDNFTGAGLTELKEMAIQAAITERSVDENGKVILKAAHFEHALHLIELKKQFMDQLEQQEQQQQQGSDPQNDPSTKEAVSR